MRVHEPISLHAARNMHDWRQVNTLSCRMGRIIVFAPTDARGVWLVAAETDWNPMPKMRIQRVVTQVLTDGVHLWAHRLAGYTGRPIGDT